jgi:HAD superfamily hydrolase (TIGR01509 family)
MAPLAGLKDWLETLHKHQIKIGLGTAADDSNTYFTLDKLGIQYFFDVIVTSDYIQEGKPSPKVYLYAAEKLKVLPENCLVFEDTISGVKAAQAAGMKVAVITTTHHEAAWQDHDVDFVFNNYLEVDFSKINQVFT